MAKCRFLTILLLSFSLIMLANGLAFAEHQCTHQVVHSDGTTTISTDCSSSKTDVPGYDPGMYHLPYYLNTQENNLLDNVNGGSQGFQDQATGVSPAKDNPQQVTAESQEKDQNTIEEQQIKQQEQEDQLENYKQQHSV